jgi:hypothetical protein
MKHRTLLFEQRLQCRRPGWIEGNRLANFNARGYGKPTVLSFHSGACSGCGSEFAACGT